MKNPMKRVKLFLILTLAVLGLAIARPASAQMFDVAKSATVLIDTEKLQSLLAGVESAEAREYIIKGFIAEQNRNSKTMTVPLGTDTYANIIGMETYPIVSTLEFASLMTAMGGLATGEVTTDQLPEMIAGLGTVMNKLKSYGGVPSLQTCFDAQGLSSEAIAAIPELEKYDVKLYLSAHIRIDPKPNSNAE